MPLLKPLITERSIADAAKNRYTFAVKASATKTEIKKAIEKMFTVRVLKIQTTVRPGKSYRTGKKWLIRRRPDGKKTLVTIEAGKSIDLFETSKQDK